MSLVEIQSLTKAYGGAQALRDVSLDIAEGEVHALCGENGAGKSTLIKILAGIVKPDSGGVQFRGAALGFGNVRRSESMGISVIHQESVAFPHLNAVDNLFVGRELKRFAGCLLDIPKMRREARRQLTALGESIPLHRPLVELPLAQRQMVSIARALMHDCRLLIMDEPTASLSERETQVLFENVARLKAQGISILYVSHRLHEIFEIADRVTVLRDGGRVATSPCSELTQDELIEQMVGRGIGSRPESWHCAVEDKTPMLSVRALTAVPHFEGVSFDVFPGEVLGLSGLVGAGRSEVARCIFGVDDYLSGSVEVAGEPLRHSSVRASCDAGIALVPEDRQHEGLVQAMAIRENFCLPWMRQMVKRGNRLDRGAMETLATQAVDRLVVRLDSLRNPVASLSGGNQQKVVLGKWLAGEPRVLILDEPTRGVDIGAKEEVYGLIRSLIEQGVAILLISSDLPELIRLSHRVVVMSEGRVTGELTGEAITESNVLRLALPDQGQAAEEDSQ